MRLLRKLFSLIMSKKAALGETCDVVGYFNPNTWPIQVAISELNLSVPLQPMEYILDRSGRKINDPILEPYVGPKMLQRETSNKPVNILRIPTRPVPVADPRAHPIGQGFKDARGKWQPPAPADPNSPITGQPPAPSASKSSVTGMSIEEARKRGFIGKQRIVPEDYGMDETAGSPQRGDKIPTIKSSYESPARAARPGALPKELTDAVLPAAAPLVQSLAEAAIAVAIAAQLMQLLSRGAAPAAARTLAAADDSCAAVDCGNCGSHKPETQDMVVADT